MSLPLKFLAVGCMLLLASEAIAMRPKAPRAVSKAPSLAYPERVQIPRDVPAVSMAQDKTGSEEYVILPTAIYLYGHYDGWQRFLKNTASGASIETAWTPPLLAVDQRFTAQGMRDGYEACRAFAKELLTKWPEDKVREAARQAHRSREPKAPPREAKTSTSQREGQLPRPFGPRD